MIINNYLLLVILLLGSFIVTYIVMPKIIGVATYKRLMDNPNERSSHMQMTPSLGGIAFYIVLVLGMYFTQQFDTYKISMSLVPGFLILFVIGLKDDLVVLSPITKLGAQIVSCIFVLAHPAFQIDHLHGFLGFEHINLFVAFPLSLFIMIAIINAYNLIDGIDGLASTVGIVIFTIYGILFYMTGLLFFAGISALMVGSLLAFLRFNLSTTKKIFMGDTGSLLIGFVIAVMTIRFFSIDTQYLKKLPIQLENLPLLVMAILVVPFFDTTRVFTIRLLNKRGPFSPDRNHIHHILIDYLNLSHRRASFFIGVVNFLFIAIFFLLCANAGNIKLLILMVVCVLLFVYFFYRINFSYKNLRRRLKMRNRLRKFRGVSNLI